MPTWDEMQAKIAETRELKEIAEGAKDVEGKAREASRVASGMYLQSRRELQDLFGELAGDSSVGRF